MRLWIVLTALLLSSSAFATTYSYVQSGTGYTYGTQGTGYVYNTSGVTTGTDTLPLGVP